MVGIYPLWEARKGIWGVSPALPGRDALLMRPDLHCYRSRPSWQEKQGLDRQLPYSLDHRTAGRRVLAVYVLLSYIRPQGLCRSTASKCTLRKTYRRPAPTHDISQLNCSIILYLSAKSSRETVMNSHLRATTTLDRVDGLFGSELDNVSLFESYPRPVRLTAL
jgi:hypothetical protein